MDSDSTVKTSDGTRIALNFYATGTGNGKVMVIAPGVGMTHGHYHLFAIFFKQQGFTVITFDYRGMGKSAPEKLNGYEASMHQWAVQDINAVLLYVKQSYPGQEIIYVGHCMGAEIIGLAPASQYINKMILVSTALTCEKLWPWHHRILHKISKLRNRTVSWALGYVPENKTRKRNKLPRGVYTQMANWCDNPNGLFDAFPDNNYRKINIPVLAFTFTDDWLCPPRAVKELLGHFANASVTWYHLEPRKLGVKEIGHIEFFSPTMESTLWHSVLLWINKENKNLMEEKYLKSKPYLYE
jgi:predicted alpha/beta hydrolase